jgi:hypothetical protein
MGQNYRSYDGSGNNLANPSWGQANTRVLNETPSGYSDLISSPGGEDRPNPRAISNAIFNQASNSQSRLELSDYFWSFGQFIDHDIILSRGTNEIIEILIPAGDPMFDPQNTGNVSIFLSRSEYDQSTGTSIDNPRIHINGITAWVDGSMLYGSDEDRANWLRSFQNGKLKTSEGDLLPYNTLSGHFGGILDPSSPEMDLGGMPIERYFIAGDIRANEHPFLTSMHTLFVREHNRVCDLLSFQNPTWNDERIYQHARAYVNGLLQNILYYEWLPVMGVHLEDYSGYDNQMNPSIMNVFATAAFRMGHTLISDTLLRIDENGEALEIGNMAIADAFFNPTAIDDAAGIDPYLRGMAVQMQQQMDCKMVNGLRNFLFGPPGAGGLDLAALNIMRGRERGLSDYNTIRESLGLNRINSFQEISSNPDDVAELEAMYPNMNDVDPWVAMLGESQMTEALVGETIMAILRKQFRALRDGDRYYFENSDVLNEAEISEIRSTRMSDVILRNTDIQAIQPDVFIARPFDEIIALGDQDLDALVYPNPTTGDFKFALNSKTAGEAEILIVDALGRQVDRMEIEVFPGANIYDLNIDGGYPSGYFFIGVYMENTRSQFLRIFKS